MPEIADFRHFSDQNQGKTVWFLTRFGRKSTKMAGKTRVKNDHFWGVWGRSAGLGSLIWGPPNGCTV